MERGDGVNMEKCNGGERLRSEIKDRGEGERDGGERRTEEKVRDGGIEKDGGER